MEVFVKNWEGTIPQSVAIATVNPILDGGGGQICPPAGFLNIAQKPLGLGS